MDNSKNIVIYYVNIEKLQNQEVFEKACNLLQEERRRKVLSCKQEKDKLRSLAAGLLLRYACQKQGINYEEETFGRNEVGKPIAEHFFYNLSHSGEFAVIAFGNCSVGIDVEQISSRFQGQKGEQRLLDMAKKIMDAREWDFFENSSYSIDYFMNIWTKKESYAKENGKGIGMDFKEIHTSNRPGFFSYDGIDGYAMSVYTKNESDIQIPVCVRIQEMIGY